MPRRERRKSAPPKAEPRPELFGESPLAVDCPTAFPRARGRARRFFGAQAAILEWSRGRFRAMRTPHHDGVRERAGRPGSVRADMRRRPPLNTNELAVIALEFRRAIEKSSAKRHAKIMGRFP